VEGPRPDRGEDALLVGPRPELRCTYEVAVLPGFVPAGGAPGGQPGCLGAAVELSREGREQVPGVQDCRERTGACLWVGLGVNIG